MLLGPSQEIALRARDRWHLGLFPQLYLPSRYLTSVSAFFLALLWLETHRFLWNSVFDNGSENLSPEIIRIAAVPTKYWTSRTTWNQWPFVSRGSARSRQLLSTITIRMLEHQADESCRRQTYPRTSHQAIKRMIHPQCHTPERSLWRCTKVVMQRVTMGVEIHSAPSHLQPRER